MLSFSLEKGNRLCRKLLDLGIVSLVQGAYGDRLSIQDHLKLEEIPRGESENRLREELERFQAQRNHITEKVESIRTEQADKKRSLFAELEKQLKSGVTKKPSADG